MMNNENKMKLKWYGTATILLEQGGTRLFFDPFIPIAERAYKPSVHELSKAENILVTHGHFDHIAAIPDIMKQGNGKAAVYCTATPRKALISKGVDGKRIHKIKPGDVLNVEPFTVRVLKGKHVVFDKWFIIKTILNPRMLAGMGNLVYILKENKHYNEAGETVIYEISSDDKRILLLGSLNLDDDTEYPVGVDMLILPLQGRSNISSYAMKFVDRLQPERVLLDHFNDTFPPISSDVDTEPFILLMRRKYPEVQVTYPRAGAEWMEIF